MKILFWIFCGLVLLLVVWILYIYYKINISKNIVAKTSLFTLLGEDYTNTLLVLGDSTAVGVGASIPSDSIAGHLATYANATYVENHAVSGSIVTDLQKQINLTSRKKYDRILVQIGANDMIAFHTPEKVANELKNILVPLSKKTTQLIFISAGNLGTAPLIPFFLRPLYTRLNLRYHEEFESIGKLNGITYINMYTPPQEDPFILDPKNYFVEDDFHPSSLGYKVWFIRIQETLILDNKKQ